MSFDYIFRVVKNAIARKPIINFNTVYIEIKNLWHKNGLDERIMEFEKSANGAATGSEVIINQGRYLIDLEQTDKKAFQLAKKEIADFFMLCNKSGLFFN